MPPIEITQDDDFAEFVIDGQAIQVDLSAAQGEMAKIEAEHAADAWYCFDCMRKFSKPEPSIIDTPEGIKNVPCPNCGKENFRADDAWLMTLAAYVVRLGAPRCSRNTAAKFYNAVMAQLDSLKKTPEATQSSPIGTELTPAA